MRSLLLAFCIIISTARLSIASATATIDISPATKITETTLVRITPHFDPAIAICAGKDFFLSIHNYGSFGNLKSGSPVESVISRRGEYVARIVCHRKVSGEGASENIVAEKKFTVESQENIQPGIAVKILNSAPLVVGEKVQLNWSIQGAPPGSKVAVFDGKYFVSDLEPSVGHTPLVVLRSSSCGDVSQKVKEISVVLYSDPDHAITQWCTLRLPNAASGTKNIRIHSFDTIAVQAEK